MEAKFLVHVKTFAGRQEQGEQEAYSAHPTHRVREERTCRPSQKRRVFRGRQDPEEPPEDFRGRKKRRSLRPCEGLNASRPRWGACVEEASWPLVLLTASGIDEHIRILLSVSTK